MNTHYRESLMAGQAAGANYYLLPPRGAPTGPAGNLLGRSAGSSLEFMEHREYQPGDDLRRIDWSAYARTDRLMVRLYREEVTPHLDIVLDGSRSMALADTAKPAAAVGLAALLATAAGNANFSHGLHLAGPGVAPVPNGLSSPDQWDGLDFAWTGHLGESLERLAAPLRPRAMRVLISDLLFPGEPLAMLSRLSHQAASLLVVQLLARADAEPPLAGNVRLVDSETDEVQEIYLDETARRRYAAALEQHNRLWQLACRQAGAVMVSLVAENVVRDWRLEALMSHRILSTV